MMRTGGQSGEGSSSERMAGIQYSRIHSPIAVPGPMRQRYSLSVWLSIRCLSLSYSVAQQRRLAYLPTIIESNAYVREGARWLLLLTVTTIWAGYSPYVQNLSNSHFFNRTLIYS